jgi:hypothetical protein
MASSDRRNTLSCVSDIPHIPPVRDLAFYATLVFAVGPLWLIPPLSWVFVLYSLTTGAIWHYNAPILILLAYACAEVRSCARLRLKPFRTPRRSFSLYTTLHALALSRVRAPYLPERCASFRSRSPVCSRRGSPAFRKTVTTTRPCGLRDQEAQLRTSSSWKRTTPAQLTFATVSALGAWRLSLLSALVVTLSAQVW